MLTKPICTKVQINVGSAGNNIILSGSSLCTPSAAIKQNDGFTSTSQVSGENPTNRLSERPCSSTSRISDISKPQRYAWMPNLGIPKKTKTRRIRRETQLFAKVVDVFPSPFNTLPMVVARYKNGQSQARMVMYVPAS